jgi:hypothetical protein
MAMTGAPPILLGFLIPGLKELILVALVALALYGRTGSRLLRATPYGRSIEPWLGLIRTGVSARSGTRSQQSPTKKRRRGRWFWVAAAMAAVAAAAWVATRIAIHGASRGSLP